MITKLLPLWIALTVLGYAGKRALDSELKSLEVSLFEAVVWDAIKLAIHAWLGFFAALAIAGVLLR